MDVGKIHSASSYSKLFAEVDKQDIANKKKENDISSDKITEEYKVSSSAIIDKKIVSQNVSSSASVSNSSLQSNNDSSNGNAVPNEEVSSEQSFSTFMHDSSSPPISSGISPIGTRIEFTIEKELNLVVTTVRDLNNDNVIRQLPPEDTISRMKMLKSYYKQKAQASLGNKVDEIIK
ncbi:MAG: flagellar protein FlaG [Candidatus Kuenenia sp.]|nr:flagellar protein FlaG [Candidatus Kuenenia hertensis]